MRTFSRDMHLPSAAKLWHIPHAAALPIPSPPEARSVPLLVQATSYFAESDLTVSKQHDQLVKQIHALTRFQTFVRMYYTIEHLFVSRA